MELELNLFSAPSPPEQRPTTPPPPKPVLRNPPSKVGNEVSPLLELARREDLTAFYEEAHKPIFDYSASRDEAIADANELVRRAYARLQGEKDPEKRKAAQADYRDAQNALRDLHGYQQ